MEYQKLPKKLLRVEDLTFVLPDDFEGGLEDATRLLLDYLHQGMKSSEQTDRSEDEKLEIILNADNERKLSINYGIFEMGEDGIYKLC